MVYEVSTPVIGADTDVIDVPTATQVGEDKPAFVKTDVSDYPEMEVMRAAEAVGPYVSESTKCKNSECPNDRTIGMVEYNGCCSVDCRKAIGIDHVDYAKSEMMLVTREEQAQIMASRG